jgi:hypothetical protein
LRANAFARSNAAANQVLVFSGINCVFMSTTTVFLCINATAGGNIARFRVAFGSEDDSRGATTHTSSAATEQVWSGLGCSLFWFWFDKGTGNTTEFGAYPRQ